MRMIRIVNTNREIPIVNSYNEPFRLGQVRRFWIFRSFEFSKFVKNNFLELSNFGILKTWNIKNKLEINSGVKGVFRGLEWFFQYHEDELGRGPSQDDSSRPTDPWSRAQNINEISDKVWHADGVMTKWWGTSSSEHLNIPLFYFQKSDVDYDFAAQLVLFVQ